MDVSEIPFAISVRVEVRDREGTVTSTGVFDWFVQALDPQ